MPRLPKIIPKTLSVRLSLIVVSAMALLLLSSLAVMLYYARRELKEEALQKAAQTLECTVMHLDNILLSVEQTAGNFYFRVAADLDSKEKMVNYSQQVIKANKYVIGCAIALEPGFYKEGECFMAYSHRRDGYDDMHIVRSDTWGPGCYTNQAWYAVPMATGDAGWRRPLDGGAIEELDTLGSSLAVITFCLPIYKSDGRRVGIMGVDVSLSLLSHIILGVKPSEHSYCTLIGSDGRYIVHPDNDKLFHRNVLTLSEEGVHESMVAAGKAMVSGETGYKWFLMDGKDYFVFFKPFKRAVVPGRTQGNIGWSTGIVYPEDDIFGDYNSLLHYVLIIAIGGLLLLFILCCIIIHSELKGLLRLTDKAQRIAENPGEAVTDDDIADSRFNSRSDEIGRLEANFARMQRSLSVHIGELKRMTTTLEERGKILHAAYAEAEKADRMKTAFLHNMTNHMLEPAETINRDVELLHSIDFQSADSRAADLAEDIERNGNNIADLLNDLIKLSDEDEGKEDRV